MKPGNNIQEVSPQEILNELVKNWIKEGNGRFRVIKKLEKLGLRWIDAVTLHDEIKYSMPEYRVRGVLFRTFQVLLLPIIIYFIFIIGGWVIGVLGALIDFIKNSPFGWIFYFHGIIVPLGIAWITSLFNN